MISPNPAKFARAFLPIYVLHTLTISLAGVLSLHAQSGPILEKLTVEDGLSQGFVYNIFQDKDGFLWFCTRNGLNRYDGREFKVFTSDPLDPYSIPENIVLAVTRYEYGQKHLADSLSYAASIALQQKETQRQRLIRNGFMGGFAVVVLFAGIFFYQRNRIKKGKQRSDELLLNILPAEVADELKAKGSADARLIDEVTVLFSDFKEFTRISEAQPPEALVAEIDECFSAFDLIVQKYGVEKIKTVGDAYLAAGGLPSPNQTHAADVIKAALEMQTFMEDRKRNRAAEDRFYFEARIGAHTGPVVAGIVGIKKFAYDIWGDTVNTAQRMESNSEAGRINISGATYNLVKDLFRCIHRGKINTKGKGDVDLYFVEG